MSKEESVKVIYEIESTWIDEIKGSLEDCLKELKACLKEKDKFKIKGAIESSIDWVEHVLGCTDNMVKNGKG